MAALVRRRRHRLRPGRALLRGVRLDRAGRRQRLHVLLRHPRRARRLDHRLGPHPRAGARRRDRRVRLVDVLRRPVPSRPASPCRSRSTASGHNLVAAAIVLILTGVICLGINVSARVNAVIVDHQGRRSSCSSSSPGCSSSSVATTRRSSRRPARRAPRRDRAGPVAAAGPRAVARRTVRRRRHLHRAPPWCSSPSSASTSSRPPPRRPRTRSATCRAASSARSRSARRSTSPCRSSITGMVKYDKVIGRGAAGRGVPLGRQAGVATIISIGALAGLTTVMMILMIGQSRVFFAMARDGLLPPVFAKVNERTGTPVPHDHHDRRRGRRDGRAAAARGAGQAGQHRHAVRVHPRGDRRRHPAPHPARPASARSARRWCRWCRSSRCSRRST